VDNNPHDWTSQVGRWTSNTRSTPIITPDEMFKSKIEFNDPTKGTKSFLVDPLEPVYAMGYKERKYSLAFEMLKQIPQQLAIINAIIQVRCNQVAAFSVPFRISKSVGFEVAHRDPGHATTKSEMEFIQHLERFVYNCGAPVPNPHNNYKRDDFESFLKKIVRDSLVFDQSTIEIIPDRTGQPYEFMAVDASTIRIAGPYAYQGLNGGLDMKDTNLMNNSTYLRNWEQRTPFRSMKTLETGRKGEVPDYVQLIHGQVANVYYRDELAFGVRNPRTDIKIAGYGYSELEMLISIITAHLYAEDYNKKFFINGSAPKGLLNLKGENLSPEMLEGFRRQWKANLEGVSNSWKTPILQAEQGVEWIDLHPSNREMEYGQWMEYLLKVSCGTFLIDPAELNFDLHGGVTQTPLFESSQEWKLKASRDRGLKPLLRFIAKQINEHIISKIDDHFVFDFVGLDELTEQEQHELRQEQVASYKTLNEVRRSEDLPDVEYGDTILNPTYVQAVNMRIQQEQQEAQAGAQQQASASTGDPAAKPPASAEAQSQQKNSAPAYTGSFSKGDTLPLDLDLFKSITKG